MAYPTQGIVANPLPGSGAFGFGQVQVFGVSGTFTIPAGVNNVRVRLWAAGGGSNGGGGGGFAMRTIYNLAGLGLTSVAVTVPPSTTGSGGTASFGSFVSATGGSGLGTNPSLGGTGFGGDINTTGGSGNVGAGGGGGGVGSMWGNGGNGGNSVSNISSGASGGGSSSSSISGGSGLTGSGGVWSAASTNFMVSPQTNMYGSIDFIGTGGGGGVGMAGVNGGGGGGSGSGGGFPGGGSGSGSGVGGAGLVIVEY